MIANRLIILSANSDQLLMSAWRVVLEALKLISDSVGEKAGITQ